MKRRQFLKGSSILIAAPYAAQSFSQSMQPFTVRTIQMQLTTPGRIGFYIDYSERNDLGDHTFYVCRTHGTSGAVSVNYTSHGDSHTQVSGTLTWQNGEADIKAVKVQVPSKLAGDHRMYLKLTSPVGGAVLHFAEHTTAYGLIDDGTVADNSDAVFCDMNASTNGDGTNQSPYHNIYDGIQNVGTKRYIYLTGSHTPDGSNTANPGGGVVNCIHPPLARENEESRVYLRNWPGRSRPIITGVGQTNVVGFFSNGFNAQRKFLTYRGLDFLNISCGNNACAGIAHIYGNSVSINVEDCNADNINGNTGNNSAFNLWGVDGSKVWKCTSNNIKKSGSNSNHNTSGVQTYDGKNISVQRCNFSNSFHGIYHKRIHSLFDVSINVRFCIFDRVECTYGASGSSGASHSYSVVQSNLFIGNSSRGGLTHNTTNTSEIGVKNWWCCNVFYECGRGEVAAIHTRLANGAQIFNNIMLDCRKVWSDTVDHSSSNSDIEYANYNHNSGITLTSQRYEWRGRNFNSSSELFSASAHGENDLISDPRFVNAGSGDYRLAAGSPCVGTGVSGTNKGIFLTGYETLGVNGIVGQPYVQAPPAPNNFCPRPVFISRNIIL